MCTFRNLFIDFSMDTLVGQDAIVFYGQNITVGVLSMSLGVLTLMFYATRPLCFLMFK